MANFYPSARSLPAETVKGWAANANRPDMGVWQPSNQNRPHGQYRPPKERPVRGYTKGTRKGAFDIKPPARSGVRVIERTAPIQGSSPIPKILARAVINAFYRGAARLNPWLSAAELLGQLAFPEGDDYLEITNPAGWTEHLCASPSCDAGGALKASATTYTVATPCICSQAISNLNNDPNKVGYWEPMRLNPSRYSHIVSFVRGSAATTPKPVAQWKPFLLPLTTPLIREALGVQIWQNPLAAPLMAPAFNLEAMAPGLRSGTRPSPGVGAEGYKAGEPRAPDPKDRTAPERPAFPEPPPRGVKERKVSSRLFASLARIYGQLTELEDFVDAVHKAIDPKCGQKAKPVWRPGVGGDDNGFSWRKDTFGNWNRERGSYRKASMPEKMAAIAASWDCINLSEAAWNVLYAQMEDRIYAAGSKLSKKAGHKRNAQYRFGYGLGPAL